MPLVPSSVLLRLAEEGNFALPAFNVPVPEFILWILEEGERLRAPVIIQVAPVEYQTLDIRMFYGALLLLSERFSIPFAFHLDHARRVEEVLCALRNGCSSVMIDGSRLPFKENVSVTRDVVALAHPLGVLVEGELGKVGGLEGDEDDDNDDAFTSPEEAEEFARRTSVDLLAVAVGTRHGFYDRTPELQLDLIEEIRHRTRLPLVLHGGSGTPQEELQKAVARGVRKINFSTALRAEYLQAFRSFVEEHPGDVAVHKMLPSLAFRVKEVVRECIVASLAQGRV
jgi:ketose-bisphosphate aldolase